MNQKYSQIERNSYAQCTTRPAPYPDIVQVIFMRQDIERGDFKEFVAAMDIDKLSREFLRGSMGKFYFSFDGYDTDPRELHAVREVRSFCQALHREWPYWFFFTALEPCVFYTMALAHVDPSQLGPQTRNGQILGAAIHTGDFKQFRSDALMQMNRPWSRAGLSSNACKRRWNSILKLLGYKRGV